MQYLIETIQEVAIQKVATVTDTIVPLAFLDNEEFPVLNGHNPMH